MGRLGKPRYSVTDTLLASFSDAGTDILGASDSIAGGCDTYVESSSRDQISTMTDYGTSVSPYLATGYGSDSYSSNDTGASTLTTDGHLLATDTFTYGEGSSNVAYDSITFANGATVSDDVASASDNYSNTDSGAITRSDSTTTSYDHFTLGDTHWTSGSFATVINDASHSESFNDASTDCDIMSASGEKNTAGDSYSFTNSETSYDAFFLSDDVYGQGGSLGVKLCFLFLGRVNKQKTKFDPKVCPEFAAGSTIRAAGWMGRSLAATSALATLRRAGPDQRGFGPTTGAWRFLQPPRGGIGNIRRRVQPSIDAQLPPEGGDALDRQFRLLRLRQRCSRKQAEREGISLETEQGTYPGRSTRAGGGPLSPEVEGYYAEVPEHKT